MSLKQYQAKRNFKKTSEPSGAQKHASETLRFCVQKHAASHLHYDFRLEYRGMLLSWAIPKGPSLNPKDKRLAIHVEDHPLEYQYFEGVIPKGNYGAGTVEIWDKGTYAVPGAHTHEEMEKILTKGLKEGHFLISLSGDKLKGSFVFQKLKQAVDDKAWLFIKKEDAYVSSEDIIEDKPSLKSSKTSKIKPSKLPDFISPMLATLVNQPFDDEDWLFEVKWDGYRALAFIDQGKVQLKSRTKHLLNQKFPPIIQNLEKIKGQVILDGELVVLDSEGKSHFELMQNYQKEKKGALVYYVFDLLFKEGQDLREQPLIERKKILKKYLKELDLPLIRLSEHIVKDGEPFFREAAKMGLEGVIGKNIGSTYQSKRSQDWVKIKTSLRQEVVIGGFTAPRGSRENLGALLVGVYNEEGEFIYAGHVGGGFNTSILQDVYDRLQPLIQKKCPFKEEPKPNAAVTWVKPQLVCEVSFLEWTKDNKMRQPIFHGLRIDKSPKTVKKESPLSIPVKESTKKQTSSKNTKELSLTHLDKVYWPQEGYTKGDLIAYYESVAPFILPYLKDRPIMLHRFPNGIEGKDFYQKDLGGTISLPDWIKTCAVQHEGKVDHYLLIHDVRSLLYAVNLGSIDLHPFLSRYKKLDAPDYCLIDLDPHDIPFEKVIEAALVIHEILEKIKVKHYCKTSGGKGLHTLIPLHGKYDYEQSRQFAEIIAHYVHKKLSTTTSMERDPKKRPKKIYLDCLQNRKGQTMAAPYAVRPRAHATVSTPLAWEEVNQDLDPSAFTIKTVLARLKEKGDLLKGTLETGINLKTALASLKKLLS